MNQNQLRDWAILGVGTASIRIRVFDRGGSVRGVFDVNAPVSPGWISGNFAPGEWNSAFFGAEILVVSGTVYVAPVSTLDALTDVAGLLARVNMNIGQVALITGESDRHPNWRT